MKKLVKVGKKTFIVDEDGSTKLVGGGKWLN